MTDPCLVELTGEFVAPRSGFDSRAFLLPKTPFSNEEITDSYRFSGLPRDEDGRGQVLGLVSG